MYEKIFAVVVSNERSGIAKAGVGTLGTVVSAHEIQIYAGIATLIYLIMLIITMIPKVKATLRQLSADRERRRCEITFSEFDFPEKKNNAPTLFERMKSAVLRLIRCVRGRK